MGQIHRPVSRTAVSALIIIFLASGVSGIRANTIARNFSEDSATSEVAQGLRSAGTLGTSTTATVIGTSALAANTISANVGYSSMIPTVLNSGSRYANSFRSAYAAAAGLSAESARTDRSGNRRRHRGSSISVAIPAAAISTGVPDSGSTLLLLGCAVGVLFWARRFLPA